MERIFWILIGCAGLFLQFMLLQKNHLQFDETFSFLITNGSNSQRTLDYKALQPAAPMVGAVKSCPELSHSDWSGLREVLEFVRSDNHPPLFFILMFGWREAFGDTLNLCRGLPFLLSLCAALLVALLGTVFGGYRVGLVGFALFVWVPSIVQHSGMLRMYSLAILFYALSFYCMVRIYKETHTGSAPVSLRWLILLGIALTGGLLTHYYYFFWAVGLVLAYLSYSVNRRLLQLLLLPATILLIMVLPWFLWGLPFQERIVEGQGLSQVRLLSDSGWLDYIQVLIGQFGELFLTRKWYASGNSDPSATALLLGSLLCLSLFLVRQKSYYRFFWIPVVVALTSEVLVDILTNRITMGWGGGRVNLYLVIPVILSVALLSKSQRIYVRGISYVFLAFLIIQSVTMYPREDTFESRQFQTLTNYLSAAANRTDVLIITYTGHNSQAQLFYHAPCGLGADVLTIEAGNPIAWQPNFSQKYEKILWVRLLGFASSIKRTADWNRVEEDFREELVTQGFIISYDERNPDGWKPFRGLAVYDRKEKAIASDM